VIIYSSDTDQTPFLEAAHFKNRQFSTWVSANCAEWKLIQHIPNRYPYTGDPQTGSVSDFYIFAKQ
jgi:hypothetical protein